MAQLLRLTFASSVLLSGFATCGAVSLLPAGDVPLPGGTLGSVAGTLLEDTSRALVGLDAFNNVRFTGTLYLRVVRATVTGKLDFHYQIKNDGSSLDAIKRMTTTNFDGFTTDVDWHVDTGTLSASRADRTTDSSSIGFRFQKASRGGFGELTPGLLSRWMVIRTDADHYSIGSTSVIDGGVANVESFAPVTAPVPEPVTMALGAAALGMAAWRRRRSA